MRIETKYNLNDIVYTIVKIKKIERTTCSICKGKGTICISDMITFGSKTFTCPECYGNKGYDKVVGEEWKVGDSFKIRKIGVEVLHFSIQDSNSKDICIHYMADRSGTMHYEDTIFATPLDAQAECYKRNNEVKEITE